MEAKQKNLIAILMSNVYKKYKTNRSRIGIIKYFLGWSSDENNKQLLSNINLSKQEVFNCKEIFVDIQNLNGSPLKDLHDFINLLVFIELDNFKNTQVQYLESFKNEEERKAIQNFFKKTLNDIKLKEYMQEVQEIKQKKTSSFLKLLNAKRNSKIFNDCIIKII